MDLILNALLVALLIIVAPIALTVVLIIIGGIRVSIAQARDHRKLMRGLDELIR